MKGAHTNGHETRAAATLIAYWSDGIASRADEWTPLDELMQADPPEPGSELELVTMTRAEFTAAVNEARLAAMRAFLRYVWFGSRNLWEAMKRLLAITRKTRPDFIRGMSATQVAWMLSETRAATSAREIRIVEGYLASWGVLAFQGIGGSKSPEARGKYAEAAKGNTNRRNGGKGRKRKPQEFTRRAAVTDADLENLANEAERKRLVKLFGDDVADCNPRRTVPNNSTKNHS